MLDDALGRAERGGVGPELAPLAHPAGGRRATRDLEFRGQQIRKDDKVVMWYMSGNRDERAHAGTSTRCGTPSITVGYAKRTPSTSLRRVFTNRRDSPM